MAVVLSSVASCLHLSTHVGPVTVCIERETASRRPSGTQSVCLKRRPDIHEAACREETEQVYEFSAADEEVFRSRLLEENNLSKNLYTETHLMQCRMHCM